MAMQYFRFLPDPAKLRREARWSGVSSVPGIGERVQPSADVGAGTVTAYFVDNGRLGVTQGTLRLDPIALYEFDPKRVHCSALRAETPVKVSRLSSQFPKTHRIGDFQPSFLAAKEARRVILSKRNAKTGLKSPNSARRRSCLLGLIAGSLV